ncbi:NAD(P)-binding domain-containing protein [Ruania halotolerans]|uniref:imine reductase family protein n=1 Tax=Ruania halotolerans TaxID=2897773 RepID=UPI001E4DAE46|nr:NAD(P)-binding domain-containing protein [Ruania halotolerans]UFU06680.1 NAD(P)-binding domain-containing protein [Ruania halotolerans]
MTDIHTESTIAVLGLGAMGAAIARAASTHGHRVVAWNRTPRPAEEFGFERASGIEVVDSPGAAVSGADLVLVCVRHHEASRAVIEEIAPVAAGLVVVNISTATPADAAASATHAADLGIRYVTGAVMVPTPMVGTEQCFVIYAGSDADIAQVRPLFDALQGTSDVVGEDHAVPPALDLAMLDIYFAGMYAHLHATALAHAHGIEPAQFLPYAEGIVDTLGGSLPGLTAAVAQRSYDSGEARLDMCLSFLEHIVTSSREAGIDPGPAELVREASARALRRWPGSTDWDVVAEDMVPARTQ